MPRPINAPLRPGDVWCSDCRRVYAAPTLTLNFDPECSDHETPLREWLAIHKGEDGGVGEPFCPMVMSGRVGGEALRIWAENRRAPYAEPEQRQGASIKVVTPQAFVANGGPGPAGGVGTVGWMGGEYDRG